MTTFAYYILQILLIISFNIGLLSILGISESISRATINILIIILFLISLTNIFKEKKMVFPIYTIFILLVLTILFSFLLNGMNYTEYFIFMAKALLYYLFFYSILNIQFTEKHLNYSLNVIFVLFVIQIIATFVKLGTIGPMEPYIGTIGVLGGSTATIIPLMAISYIFSSYLVEKNYKILFLIPFFIIIGLASNKIAIIIYLFVLLFSLLFIYSFKYSNSFFNMKIIIKHFIVFVLFTFGLSVLFVSLNPRLNPEGKIGGSIDISYVKKYISEYIDADSLSSVTNTRIKGQGRGNAHSAVYELLESDGISSVLFGFGPGDIVKSRFTSSEDLLMEKYNIGYGGRIGYLWLAVQIGYVGSTLWGLFFFLLLFKVYNKSRINKYDSRYKYILTFYGFSIIFFLDYLTYSPVFLFEQSVILVYFLLFKYVHKMLKQEKMK